MENDVLLKLTALYTDSKRHYHNLKHITSMLSGTPKPLSPEQTIAIWFHDAVYDPVSATNEEDSAVLVSRLYNTDKLAEYANPDVITKIIMSTKRHESLCPAADLVLDLDLAILGMAEPVYDEYVRGITAEYTPHVPFHLF